MILIEYRAYEIAYMISYNSETKKKNERWQQKQQWIDKN